MKTVSLNILLTRELMVCSGSGVMLEVEIGRERTDFPGGLIPAGMKIVGCQYNLVVYNVG